MMTFPSIRESWIVCILTCCLLAEASRAVEFAGGTGEPGNPYQIATAEQLVAIGADPNLLDKHYLLLNDIDLDPNLPGGRVFTRAIIAPHGACCATHFRGPKFAGSFNGTGHRIRNLTISGATAGFLGLFGAVDESGQVRDLTLENVQIDGSAQHVGGLAGWSAGTIIGCSSTGRVSGLKYVGGMVGEVGGVAYHVATLVDSYAAVTVVGGDCSENLGGLVGATGAGEVITHCHATGAVSGGVKSLFLGGLIGFNLLADVTDCYATGGVFAGPDSGCLGGLMGYNCGGNVVRCYANGTVSGGVGSVTLGGLIGGLFMEGVVQYCYTSGEITAGPDCGGLGGLVGFNESSTILDCYSAGRISTGERSRQIAGLVGSNNGVILRCYATGHISADASCNDLGGLVARKVGGEITGCFWDVEAVGLSESAGGTGLTTAQMQHMDIFVAAGWDFVGEHSTGLIDVWQMPPGGGYPQLAGLPDTGGQAQLPGNGTRDDPYRISTPEDLVAMRRHDPCACYVLENSIDLDGIRWNEAPIPVFDGTFDGCGFSVFSLSVRGLSDLGLFGTLGEHALIVDLRIEDANIIGAENAQHLGILMGSCRGTIRNSQVSGTILAGYNSKYVGGLAGHNHGQMDGCSGTVNIAAGAKSRDVGGLAGASDGTISHCHSSPEVHAAQGARHIGGLVGYQQGHAVDCHANGVLSTGADGWFVGGLFGLNSGTVSSSHSTCMVAGGTNATSVGGLAGTNAGSLDGSYALGRVSCDDGSRYIGGLVGGNGGTIADCYAAGPVDCGDSVTGAAGLVGSTGGSIANCYAAGQVSPGKDNIGVGSFAGEQTADATTTGCYFLAPAGGVGPADNGIGLPLSDAQMKQQASFAGWDFENIWMICEGKGYPRLRWEGIECNQP